VSDGVPFFPGITPGICDRLLLRYASDPHPMKFAYTILYVQNVQQTVDFYESAFGLRRRFVHESGQYAEMETGGTALAFASEELVGEEIRFRATRAADAPPGAEIGLVTEDVASDFRRAVSAGAVPVQEPKVKPWGQTVSYVRDQNGFLVEICSAVS
jgi:lactoylglutathione lyase